MQLREIKVGEEYAVHPDRYMSRSDSQKFRYAIRARIIEVGIVVGSSRGYSTRPKKGVLVEALEAGENGWGKKTVKGSKFLAESRRVLEPWLEFATRKAAYDAGVQARRDQADADKAAVDYARKILCEDYGIPAEEIKRASQWQGSGSYRFGIELSPAAVQKIVESDDDDAELRGSPE